MPENVEMTFAPIKNICQISMSIDYVNAVLDFTRWEQ